MKTNPRVRRIILFQNLGFLSISVLCLVDELVQLPVFIASGHALAFLLYRPTLELLLTLAIWYLVNTSTRRILEHLHYLEKFLRVCAWCRRINYNGQWMPLEDFMEQGFDTPTTHGTCQDCLDKQKAALKRAKEARKKFEAEKKG